MCNQANVASSPDLHGKSCWALLRTLNPLLAVVEPRRFLAVIKPLVREEDFSLVVQYLVSIRFPIRFSVVIGDGEMDSEGDGQSSPTAGTIARPDASSVEIVWSSS